MHALILYCEALGAEYSIVSTQGSTEEGYCKFGTITMVG